MAVKRKPRKPKAKKSNKEKQVKQKQKQSQNVRQVVNIYRPARRSYARRKPAAVPPAAMTNMSLNTDGFINQTPYILNTLEALVKQHTKRFIKPEPKLNEVVEDMYRNTVPTSAPEMPNLLPTVSTQTDDAPVYG